MADIDKQYHKLSEAVINTGYEYFTDNRPDVPCRQVTSANLEINLQKEFPLLTTKKMFTKGIVEELLWFLRGEGTIKPLLARGVNIWNQDAHNFEKRIFPNQVDLGLDEFIEGIKEGVNTGDVGRNYGVQWRHWQGNPELFRLNIQPFSMSEEEQQKIVKLLEDWQTQPFMWVDDTKVTSQLKRVDQIQELITNLCKPNPINRRHIVTAWNPAETNDTALPPCHWAFEILPRPLTYAMRIEASGKDIVWLNSLWQEAFSISQDEDAKATLEQELAHVPHYGFVLKWHQRSCDLFLGIPFNIASYALLANMIGTMVGMVPLSIIGDLSNVHFYQPHIEVVEEQLRNNPSFYSGCTLAYSDRYISNLEDYKAERITFDEFISSLTYEDFYFENYESFPSLKADMFAPTE